MAASAFAVESANVVGYTQVTCPAGQQYIMLGVPFDCPTNLVDGFAMDDLFPNAIQNGFKGGTSSGNADYLVEARKIYGLTVRGRTVRYANMVDVW